MPHVLTTINVSFSFSGQQNRSITSFYLQKEGFVENSLGYTLTVMAGLCLALDTLLMKKSPYLMENYLTATYWCYFIATLISAVAMVIFEHLVLPQNWYQVLLILGHAIGFVFQWPLYSFTVKYLSGTMVAILYSTTVAFMLIPQYTVLSSILPGHRNSIEVVGVIFVVVGSALKSVFELYQSRHE